MHDIPTRLPTTALTAALDRITGDPGTRASGLRLLRDAGENYPAWLDAIRGARARIDFENFIFADDETGRTFAEALIERARAGVRVRVLTDWLGSAFRGSRALRRAMEDAGIVVRVFGLPLPRRPHWFVRDHRKMLAVDGETGFVSGLCVSDDWTGRRGVAPWRDTGVGFSGAAAVAGLERAFAETWAAARGHRKDDVAPEETAPPRLLEPGDATIRLVRGRPGAPRLYRFDLAALAQCERRAWFTDSYFLPTQAYREALRDAARDGVDVRVLVPGANDVPLLPALVRTQYRTLLEAGVRIYEWSGPMLHAKAAVFDGRLARVGSTNLNQSSFAGNYELDVVVDDPAFGEAAETMFLADLAEATEIVLPDEAGAPPLPKLARVDLAAPGLANRARQVRPGVAAAGLGRVVAAAIVQRAPLSRYEVAGAATLAALCLASAVTITLFPGLVVFTLAVMLIWLAVALGLRALREARRLRRDNDGLRAQTRRLLARLRK